MKEIKSISKNDIQALEASAEDNPNLPLRLTLSASCKGFYGLLDWIEKFCCCTQEGIFIDELNQRQYRVLKDSLDNAVQIDVYSRYSERF
jgi:hypothetical protein